MNLQTKFFLSISAGVLTVLVVAETLRQRRQGQTNSELSAVNLQRLEVATRGNLRNLQESVLVALRDAMNQGEMDRLTQVMQWQRGIEGLLECSLVGTRGKVSYSSDPSALKRPLEGSLHEQLFANTNRLERQTADAFEIYVPLVAEKSCVECHTEWKLGQVGGVQLLRFSNAGYRQAQADWGASTSKLRRDSLLAGAFASVGILVVLVVLVNLQVRWQLTRPLQRAAETLDRVSKGDLTAEVDPALKPRQDEIGRLAWSMQAMLDGLRKLLRDVSNGVQTLAASSNQLSSVSSQTAASVQGMSERATTVAAAAEQSSANTSSVATSMERAASNLSSVASATEEMSATVADIASNSEKARAISERATAQVQTISSLMQQLGSAAQEIGKVTQTITDISSLTNLLALNATIEAARAGAAGKGFAVVANEIKDLARQTAAATEDIKAKVLRVQTSTGGAVADIEMISGVIREVSGIVASIASAIEQQATVTRDVAGNIAQASAGVQEANQRVMETATVSKTIARDMAGVSAAVGEIRQGGELVQTSAEELSRLADQLRTLVGQFKVSTSNPSEREPLPRFGDRPLTRSPLILTHSAKNN